MGRKSRKFYARLSEVMSEKRKENYAFIASWIRRKIDVALGNSLCTCLSGRRSVYYTSHTYSENSLSSFAKVSEVHQMLVQLYYHFQFRILHTLYATTALNVIW